MADQWHDYDDFPVADWQYAVTNNDTRMGYLDWRMVQQAIREGERYAQI